MTTIATDGITMAADSRVGRNDMIVSNRHMKIARLQDGTLLGLSGRASTLSALVAYFDGSMPFPKDQGEWAALYLTSEGIRLYSSDAGQAWVWVDPPHAIGSGCELALGAMLAGCSPVKAVEIAAIRDPFTGGPVEVMKVGC